MLIEIERCSFLRRKTALFHHLRNLFCSCVKISSHLLHDFWLLLELFVEFSQFFRFGQMFLFILIHDQVRRSGPGGFQSVNGIIEVCENMKLFGAILRKLCFYWVNILAELAQSWVVFLCNFCVLNPGPTGAIFLLFEHVFLSFEVMDELFHADDPLMGEFDLVLSLKEIFSKF